MTLKISDRIDWLWIALTAILAHASALPGDYIWLDHAHIEDGLALAKPEDWITLFQGSFAGTGFYRPLMALSLSIDALIAKTPLFFRAVTETWHALAAVMTLIAARSLGLGRRAALISGLLFAVHPISSLVANAIAFRSEAMIAVALLGLVVAHERGAAKLAALALFAGSLSKETALVLAPLFVLVLELERRIRRSEARKASRENMRLLAFEGGALICALILRLRYAPTWRASFPNLSLDEAVGTRLASIGKSAAAIFVPFDPSICDAFPISSTFSATALLGLVLIFAAIYLAVKGGVLARLFVVSLLPALSLVPLTRFWSPHYLYVATAFAVMLVAKLCDRHRAAEAALAMVIALFGVISFVIGFRYRDDTALFTPEVLATPECREAHFFLAEAAREKHDWESAARSYELAISESPNYLAYADVGAALQNLGAIRSEQRNWPLAKAAFSQALEHTSDALEQRQLTYNLAMATLQAGDAAEAARLLDAETARGDAFPEALFVRARALHDLGREQEALELLKRFQQGTR